MTGVIKLTFIIISLCIVRSSIFRSEQKSYATFRIFQEETADSGPVLKDLPATTAVQCTLKCIYTNACKSVNYKAADGRCQLIARGKKESAPFLVKKAGWTFMTTDEQEEYIRPGCDRQSPCKDNNCTEICNGKGYKCICDRNYCGQLCGNETTDCTSVHKSGSKQDGVYNINVKGSGVNMNVFCDMTDQNEGWIVIQRRLNDSVNFYRNWAAYKEGFGDLSGSMWIGLDKLHLLAGPGKNATLRVDLKHYTEPNKLYYAEYTTFEIGNEAEKYKLVIGGYSGTAGDPMAYHNGMKFTTSDQDNDLWSGGNCAVHHRGAWWLDNCYHANLNTLYPTKADAGVSSMKWGTLSGSIIYSEMKIKYK